MELRGENDLYEAAEGLMLKMIHEADSGVTKNPDGTPQVLDFSDRVKLLDAATRLLAYKAKHQPEKKASQVDVLRDALRNPAKQRGDSRRPAGQAANGAGQA